MQDRDRKSKQANEKFHDRIAARYDDIYSEQNPYWRFYREITWRHLKPFLPRISGAKVLDLGCGSGEWGIRMLKSGFTATFVDLSHGMIETARRRAGEEIPRGNSTFLQADLVDLSALPENEYAFATAQGDPISLCSNPARALREIAKRLTPESFLIASMDNRTAAYDHYLEKEDIEGLLQFHRSGETLWLARDKEERFPVHTFDAQELRDLFAKAGFEVVHIIGKTILPVRKYPQLLEDPQSYRKLLQLEEDLHAKESYLGRASHLQIAAKKK